MNSGEDLEFVAEACRVSVGVAARLLATHGGDVQAAVLAGLGDRSSASPAGHATKASASSEDVVLIDSESDQERSPAAKRSCPSVGEASVPPSTAPTTQAEAPPSSASQVASEHTVGQLGVVTWNINGLTEEPGLLKPRLRMVAHELLQLRGLDVILLQEMTTTTVALLQPLLQARFPHMRVGSTQPYFTAMYSRLPLLETQRLAFDREATSAMCRNLLMAEIEPQPGTRVCLLTSHLESLRQGATARVAQAQRVQEELARPDCLWAIFGGDTNLRVAETKQLSTTAKQHGIKDLFDLAGCPKEARYTWDMQVNDTLHMDRGPRMRLDQLWARPPPDDAGFDVAHYALIGTRRSESFGFASDHFGIWTIIRYTPDTCKTRKQAAP